MVALWAAVFRIHAVSLAVPLHLARLAPSLTVVAVIAAQEHRFRVVSMQHHAQWAAVRPASARPVGLQDGHAAGDQT